MSQLSALVLNASDFAGPPAVHALLAGGYRVYAADRVFDQPTARQAFAEAHPDAILLAGEGPEQWVQRAWAEAGRIEALISNDHFPALQRATEQVPPDDLRATLEALVVAPFRAIQAAIPLFRKQGGGNIVMITSCRTKLPIPGGAVPDAARDAANALMRSFAVEFAPDNIAINAVAPNFLYSEAYYPRAVYLDDAKGREFVAQSVPAGRLGRPEEIGDVIRFLATTPSRFLTGAQIDFSGGWPSAPIRLADRIRARE
jgi:3-oxoacyl-[acyl-carrier protein] reductase